MKIIYEKQVIEDKVNNYRYIWYKDRNIDYEEETEKSIDHDKRCMCEINVNNFEPVEMLLKNDQEVSIYTLMYFYYIASTHSIPIVRSNDVGEILFDRISKVNNRLNMKFALNPGKETYSLELGNTFLLLKKPFESPFDIKNEIINEIKVLDDRIFIIDHDYEEFYDLNSNYKNSITGKMNKGIVKEYIEKPSGYKTSYKIEENNITGLSTDNPNIGFIYHESKYKDSTMYEYYLPFVQTTDGIIIPKKDHKIYCTVEVCKYETEVETTTNVYEVSGGIIKESVN